MDRKRNSEKPQPQEHPVEPEMERRPEQEEAHARTPASEPPKKKRGDDL